jgi:hypothetical protein
MFEEPPDEPALAVAGEA